MTKSLITVPAFHGSGTIITAFDYQFTDQGNDQLGSGWYFTTDKKEAEEYAIRSIDDKPKIGGDDKPTLHAVTLTFQNLLRADAMGAISAAQAERIIRASPDLNNCLENWGDVPYEGEKKIISQAANSYARKNIELLKLFNHLSTDFFRGHVEQFNHAIRTEFGYDGVISKLDDRTHYVAWFPEQICIVTTSELLASPSATRRLKL